MIEIFTDGVIWIGFVDGLPEEIAHTEEEIVRWAVDQGGLYHFYALPVCFDTDDAGDIYVTDGE